MFWKNLPNEETPINADNLSRSERYLQATASANGDFFVDINGADGLTEGDVVRIMFPSSANPQKDARLSIDGGSNYNFIAINENIKKAESVENDKLELVYDGENWQIILTSENIKRPDNSTVEDGIEALDTSLSDGWISVNETWTYASPTTINVPSGATLNYNKGGKLKIIQNTTKYFYIIKVEDNLLTITGGSDYTLTNDTITEAFYSNIQNPQDFPDKFNFTAVVDSAGTTPTYSVNECSFQVNGTMCIVNYTLANESGGTAGSGSQHITISTPVPASIATRIGFGSVYNGGALVAGSVAPLFLAVYEPTGNVFMMMNNGGNITCNHQNNANRYIQMTLIYQI